MKHALFALGLLFVLSATAHAQVYVTPAPTVTYYAPSAPLVSAPVVSTPVTTYYAPSVTTPVTTYYAPSVSAPVTTYYAPAATTAYYAPAPVTTYYAPTTAYYAPTTTYYAPATTAYYATPVVVAPRVYVPGQPVRNTLRAIAQ